MWMDEQAAPQPPQCAGLGLRFASQPSVATVLQSAKPILQPVTVQAPAAQPAVALASMQTLLQPPQWLGSVLTSCSQPSACLLLLQSAQPGLQVPLQAL